jgi:hypothetical protein
MLITLFSFCLSVTALAQQAKLEGQVVNDKDRPVAGARLGAGGGQSTVTDARGHFKIIFPTSIQPGQATRIHVAKPGWVIYQPLFGDCVTQDANVNVPLRVVIVPRGSTLSLSSKRLSQIMSNLVAERGARAAALRSLKEAPNEDAFLRRYAEQYGLTLEQLQDAVTQWARAKDSDDKEERALKEYWKGNYAKAAQLVEESAKTAEEALKLAQESAKEANERVVKMLNLKIKVYRAMLERHTREQSPPEWASAQNNLCAASLELGHRLSGTAAVNKWNETVTACRAALSVYTREQSPQEWAKAQNNLDLALKALKEASVEIHE